MTISYTILCGLAEEKLQLIPDNSVDSVVMDPPYALGEHPDILEMLHDWLTTGVHQVKSKKGGFMGLKWDEFVPQPQLWRECLRILKPGGHLVTFGGTRTYDLVVLGLRIAGFEIRDQIAWVYAEGYPKSMDISKAIDKTLGVERPVVGTVERWGNNASGGRGGQQSNCYQPTEPGARKWDQVTTPGSPEAAQWEGWGTALKPAMEPICIARKPLEKGLTLTENILKWGVGCINIDACRIAITEEDLEVSRMKSTKNPEANSTYESRPDKIYGKKEFGLCNPISEKGRWPANVIHDGSPDVVNLFDAQYPPDRPDLTAARYFFCPKASTDDREEGLNHLPIVAIGMSNGATTAIARGETDYMENAQLGLNKIKMWRNTHPTVKPTPLMRHLVRLVTPVGGLTVDPVMGSGSTGKAAMMEGINFWGCDMEEHNIPIATARVEYGYRMYNQRQFSLF